MSAPYAADDPEGSRPQRSQYVSRKELLILLAGVGLIALALVPLYFRLLRDRNNAVCKQNLKAIWDATQLYTADNDGFLPPAFYSDYAGGIAPIGEGNPYPVTWAALIEGWMKQRKDFKCPEAQPDEVGLVGSFTGPPIELTYGLYSPFSLRRFAGITNPARTVLFAETANGGARNSFNPMPFGRADSFLVGLSSGNVFDEANAQGQDAVDFSAMYREATSVTRLPFSDTADGRFTADKAGRHDGGNHVIFADGSIGTLTADEALVERRSRREGNLIGLWATR